VKSKLTAEFLIVVSFVQAWRKCWPQKIQDFINLKIDGQQHHLLKADIHYILWLFKLVFRFTVYDLVNFFSNCRHCQTSFAWQDINIYMISFRYLNNINRLWNIFYSRPTGQTEKNQVLGHYLWELLHREILGRGGKRCRLPTYDPLLLLGTFFSPLNFMEYLA
jgi:hypothetical protein